MNSEPSYFLTFINNGMTLPRLVEMKLSRFWPPLAPTRALASQKVLDFSRPLEQRFIRKQS